MTPYYGVYTSSGAPPANAEVSVWVMPTMAGISVQLYAQLQPDYTWVSLTSTTTLAPNVWKELQVTMPDADSFYIGLLINSPFDISGAVYLDDIVW